MPRFYERGRENQEYLKPAEMEYKNDKTIDYADIQEDNNYLQRNPEENHKIKSYTIHSIFSPFYYTNDWKYSGMVQTLQTKLLNFSIMKRYSEGGLPCRT